MKAIPGFENIYSASEDGRIFSHKNNIWLKLVKQGNGYLTVTLFKNRIGKMFSVHRIIAITYLPNPDKLKTVNHKDMNKHNNTVQNLEWASYQDNLLHATANGCHIGERNGNSVLTKEQVIEIRSKYKYRVCTHKHLAKEYGVRDNYVFRIINRKVWKHI